MKLNEQEGQKFNQNSKIPVSRWSIPKFLFSPARNCCMDFTSPQGTKKEYNVWLQLQQGPNNIGDDLYLFLFVNGGESFRTEFIDWFPIFNAQSNTKVHTRAKHKSSNNKENMVHSPSHCQHQIKTKSKQSKHLSIFTLH